MRLLFTRKKKKAKRGIENAKISIIQTLLHTASKFSASRFLFFLFFARICWLWRQTLLLWTVYLLFTYCAYTVHILKNIKNESHNTIYTFKYYFTTVFLVFSFQFSATISQNIQFFQNNSCHIIYFKQNFIEILIFSWLF